jgi:hypothetical protein
MTVTGSLYFFVRRNYVTSFLKPASQPSLVTKGANHGSI